MAQLGSARRSGRRGRRFESGRPDKFSPRRGDQSEHQPVGRALFTGPYPFKGNPTDSRCIKPIMNCPRCDVILIPTHATGNRFECPRCNGRLSNSNDVGLLLSYAQRNRLVSAATSQTYDGLSCPFCHATMAPVELTHRLGVMEVDVCEPCVALWTDPGEITKLSKSTVGSAPAQSVTEMNPDLPLSWHRRSVSGDADRSVTGGLLSLLVKIFTARI